MGKIENDEFSFSITSTAAAEAASLEEANRRRELEERGYFGNFWVYFNNKILNFKCIFALLLGISVFISALFWLPPFLKLTDPGADKDLDPRFRGYPVVASFKLQKPVSYVKDNVLQLEADIYDELEATAKVVIISTESSGLNSTDVVFGFDKHSKIPPAELSLIRSIFEAFVTRENKLLLTSSVFGEPSFFEMLRFPGGITIRPPQSVYPLQKVQIYFNFTLNNPIVQIQENFGALLDQLKSGLHLTHEENLYISLTNSRGSTVAPPATVQTSVVLTVGVSVPRMKQIAKTIKDSPARNLGLNNTVFGKVKQVSLSSILPAGGASGPTAAPAPGPVPHSHHHHHRHHHHHHHHHYHGTYYPPATAPTYAPKRAPHPVTVSPPPWKSYRAIPPSAPSPVQSYHASPPGCRFRFKHKHSGRSPEHSPTSIAAAPSRSLHHRFSAASPHRQAKPPTPIVHQISPSSPLGNVIYARARPPPSGGETDPEPPDKAPSVAPLPSCAGRTMTVHWILSLVILLLLCP